MITFLMRTLIFVTELCRKFGVETLDCSRIGYDANDYFLIYYSTHARSAERSSPAPDLCIIYEGTCTGNLLAMHEWSGSVVCAVGRFPTHGRRWLTWFQMTSLRSRQWWVVSWCFLRPWSPFYSCAPIIVLYKFVGSCISSINIFKIVVRDDLMNWVPMSVRPLTFHKQTSSRAKILGRFQLNVVWGIRAMSYFQFMFSV